MARRLAVTGRDTGLWSFDPERLQGTTWVDAVVCKSQNGDQFKVAEIMRPHDGYFIAHAHADIVALLEELAAVKLERDVANMKTGIATALRDLSARSADDAKNELAAVLQAIQPPPGPDDYQPQVPTEPTPAALAVKNGRCPAHGANAHQGCVACALAHALRGVQHRLLVADKACMDLADKCARLESQLSEIRALRAAQNAARPVGG